MPTDFELRTLSVRQHLMRKLVLQIGIFLLVFAVGVVSGVLWKSRRSNVLTVAPVGQVIKEEPWPLTKEIVSRSLQSHSFRTDKLRRNSNEEVVWRWLQGVNSLVSAKLG